MSVCKCVVCVCVYVRIFLCMSVMVCACTVTHKEIEKCVFNVRLLAVIPVRLVKA